jgi:hypothetical protein
MLPAQCGEVGRQSVRLFIPQVQVLHGGTRDDPAWVEKQRSEVLRPSAGAYSIQCRANFLPAPSDLVTAATLVLLEQLRAFGAERISPCIQTPSHPSWNQGRVDLDSQEGCQIASRRGSHNYRGHA